jgi:murein DD-endopeptidase MepM/ murein hydrolase activator NlpD
MKDSALKSTEVQKPTMHGHRLTVVLAASLACVIACAPSGEWGEGTGGPARETVTYHTVQRGETLSSVAERYDVPLKRLIRENDIGDPDLIRVGQRLRVVGTGGGGPSVKKIAVPSTPPPKLTGPVKATGRFKWPVRGKVIGRYSSSRRGIVISARSGTTVKAADGGRVVLAAEHMRGYGKVVMLDHGNGYTSVYAHNSALLVEEGEAVRQGQAIARVGSTGRASGSRLQFRIYRHGVPMDPSKRLQ